MYRIIRHLSLYCQINPVHALQNIPLRFILILHFYLRQGFPSGLFPSVFPNKILYYCRFFLTHTYALPVSMSLISSAIHYSMRSTTHEVYNCAVFSIFHLIPVGPR